MKFSRILVSVNGGGADREAVDLACKTAKRAKGKVYVIYVIEIKRALPLEARIEPEIQRAEEILNHAEDIAEEADYEVETELLQAREVGAALIDEVIERKIDLIVMALNYKKRFGEFSMGNAVPYVLKNAPCPVLLFREPIPQEPAV